MSENKREMTKVTIELPNGDTNVIECHGLAMVTLEDKEDKYNTGVVVMGNLSIPELMCLKETTEKKLVDAIDINIAQCPSKMKNHFATLLAILGGK